MYEYLVSYPSISFLSITLPKRSYEKYSSSPKAFVIHSTSPIRFLLYLVILGTFASLRLSDICLPYFSFVFDISFNEFFLSSSSIHESNSLLPSCLYTVASLPALSYPYSVLFPMASKTEVSFPPGE